MFSPLDKLLNLPGMTVNKWSQTSEGLCLHLARVNSSINCPHCHLKVPRQQFYCRHCQKYITEELDYIDTKRKETRRYQENIYQKVLKSSIEQVTQEENLT
jgi:hypothetical protein